MELHLIRHPRPDVAPGVCYGRSDLGLAESATEVTFRDSLLGTLKFSPAAITSQHAPIVW